MENCSSLSSNESGYMPEIPSSTISLQDAKANLLKKWIVDGKAIDYVPVIVFES